MDNFKDKVVLVTGGGSGIGRETAIQFASQGALVIIADNHQNNGNETVYNICQTGGYAKYVMADISLSNDVDNLVTSILKEFKCIDILVNNAGIEISGKVVKFDEASFDKLVAVNFKSVFLCSKAVLPQMQLQQKGSIVNVASVASILAWPNDVVYSATKAAVLLLTKGMAVEYAKYNIRVNAVAPGIINTAMTSRALADCIDQSAIIEEKSKLHPLGRFGEVHEVAQTILFLSSEHASFITGVALPVDGGYLAG